MIAKYKNESWRARIVKRRTEYNQDHGYCMIVGIIIISLSTDGFFSDEICDRAVDNL